MSLIEILLVAIGLAMDCFAVSVACALVMKRFQWWPMLRLAFMFGLFQALMPCLGWLAGSQFYGYIHRFDHWIAFGILAFLGIRMIWENLHPGHNGRSVIDPYRWRTVLVLAVATSIDALAVGLSFSLLDISLWMAVAIIGMVSFVLSWVALLLSLATGDRLTKRAELLGGLILIAIGLKILLTHLAV